MVSTISLPGVGAGTRLADGPRPVGTAGLARRRFALGRRDSYGGNQPGEHYPLLSDFDDGRRSFEPLWAIDHDTTRLYLGLQRFEQVQRPGGLVQYAQLMALTFHAGGYLNPQRGAGGGEAIGRRRRDVCGGAHRAALRIGHERSWLAAPALSPWQNGQPSTPIRSKHGGNSCASKLLSVISKYSPVGIGNATVY